MADSSMYQEVENRTLEMLAVAMSEEYGVSVVCNGQIAETRYDPGTGRALITIPAIPVVDRYYRALLRGYVDHEVGHIRFSDRVLLTDGPLRHPQYAGSLKNITGLFEDVVIEKAMGECFPGCRRNLRTFATLIYLEHDSPVLPPPLQPVDAQTALEDLAADRLAEREIPYLIWTAFTQYLLFRARSEMLPRFAKRLALFREPVDVLAPGLADLVEPILIRVAGARNTQETMALALEVIETAFACFVARSGDETDFFTPKMLDTMRWILRNGGSAKDTVDIARAAELLVDKVASVIDPSLLDNQITCHNPVGSPVWETRIRELTAEEQLEALQASARMEAQMQALLQSFELNRSGPTRTGRLNTKTLHKLFTCRSDVFFRRIERQRINTKVVLCIDMSGSMRFDDKAILASKALYSLAHCLAKIRGLALGIIGFFDNQAVDIMREGDRITGRMSIQPDGGTLCGNALKYAMQTFRTSSKIRKIVIMITDGDANDGDDFEKVIERARRSGVELLGVGITDDHIARYLPPGECCIINDVRDLAAEILRMLRKKLVGSHEAGSGAA